MLPFAIVVFSSIKIIEQTYGNRLITTPVYQLIQKNGLIKLLNF